MTNLELITYAEQNAQSGTLLTHDRLYSCCPLSQRVQNGAHWERRHAELHTR